MQQIKTKGKIRSMKSVFKNQSNSIVDIKNNIIIIPGLNFMCRGNLVKQFILDCLI
jgi:hypothetical protein